MMTFGNFGWSMTVIYTWGAMARTTMCNDGTHQKQSREKSTGSGFLHYYIQKYYICATNYHHIILLKSFGCDPISAIY